MYSLIPLRYSILIEFNINCRFYRWFEKLEKNIKSRKKLLYWAFWAIWWSVIADQRLESCVTALHERYQLKHHCRRCNMHISLTLKSPPIGHVNNIPSMQFFTRISWYTRSKSYMLSLTECVWEFRNNALWDTQYHALLNHIILWKAVCILL